MGSERVRAAPKAGAKMFPSAACLAGGGGGGGGPLFCEMARGRSQAAVDPWPELPVRCARAARAQISGRWKVVAGGRLEEIGGRPRALAARNLDRRDGRNPIEMSRIH